MNEKCFHSCYVTDVKVGKDTITIVDSSRGMWKIDAANADLVAQFKKWMASVFLKGVPQTLTVFEYEDRSTEVDFDFWIVKFCNLPKENA